MRRGTAATKEAVRSATDLEAPINRPRDLSEVPRLAAAFVFFAALVGILQLQIPYPIDDDTAYHFAVAALMRTHGVLRAFPWTPFSWQFQHYADKEFLFHVLFMPLIPLGLLSAQRVVGAVGGGAVLTAMYAVLRREAVPYAALWTILPLGSVTFLVRFLEVRPHLLSMALAIVLLWGLTRRSFRVVAVAAVLYPLCYVGFWQLSLILAAASLAAVWLSRRTIWWQGALVLAGGIAAGVVLHPNSRSLLEINWIHMVDILYGVAWTGAAPADIGNEYAPFPAAAWMRFLLVSSALWLCALFWSWKARRADPLPLAVALAATAFWLLATRTARFVEYAVPLGTLACALASCAMRRSWLLAAATVATVVYATCFAAPTIRYVMAAETKNGIIEPQTARELAERIPVNASVFTCGWEYTGSLMAALPERRFIVAEDPTLFYKIDPRRHDIWRRLPVAAPPDAAAVIEREFGSQFVICRNAVMYGSLLDRLRQTPGDRILVVSPRWAAFALGHS